MFYLKMKQENLNLCAQPNERIAKASVVSVISATLLSLAARLLKASPGGWGVNVVGSDAASGTFVLAASICLLPILMQTAFSTRVAEYIKERDGYRCVTCGATENLEASHLNHDKKNRNYNNPSNGRTQCSSCHLDDHINRAGRNGLSQQHNDWAIDTITKRVNERR